MEMRIYIPAETSTALIPEALAASLVNWQQRQLQSYRADGERILQRLAAGNNNDFLIERAMSLLLNYLSLPRYVTTDLQSDEIMIRLSLSLFEDFWPRGYWRLISDWWPPLIEIAQRLPDPHLKMRVITHYSLVKCNQGQVGESLKLCEPLIYSPDFSHLSSFEQAGILHHLGGWYVWLGDYQKATRLITWCFDLAEAGQHWEFKAYAFNLLGSVALFQGDFKRARTCYEQCLALLIDHDGENNLVCIGYRSLGRLFIYQKRFAEAIPLLEKTLAIQYHWHNQEGIADNSFFLAQAYLGCGRIQEVEPLLDKALSICKNLEYALGITLCHLSFGQLEEKRGIYAQAITHYRRALVMLDTNPLLPEELRVLFHLLPLLLRRGRLWTFAATLPRLWRNVNRQRLGPKAIWRLWRGK
jgi:tetratricopeptide (TPR) repeat protein